MTVNGVKRADAVANIERILTAAAQLFAEQAIDAVTMEEIAAVAGVGKGTLYRRFPTKGDLCLALLQAQLTAFQTEVSAALAQLTARGESKVNQLRYFLEQVIRFNDANLRMLFAVVQYASLRPDTKQYPVEWEYAVVQRLLMEAVQAGEIVAIFDVAILADLLIAGLRPPVLRFYRELRGYSVAQISTEVHKLVQQLALPKETSYDPKPFLPLRTL